jgi:hypothetical protein
MATRHLVALLLTLALASCGSPEPSSPAENQTPNLLPSPSSAGTPGRPYDGAAILQSMRESRRPGGVPAQLQTDEIAAAVANELWTWDGRAWPQLIIGGACGDSTCSLEVSGAPAEAAGADLYVLTIDPASAAVAAEGTDLHGYPAWVEADLRSAALAAAPDAIEGLTFVSARWLPPPDAGQYWLSYRSGGEEGSPGVDLRLDLASGTLLEERPI